MSNCILKELKGVLITPLKILFNLSLSEGLFPLQMKHANVVPIHIGKNKQERSNYRPISLLITMSKLLEKIMYKRIYRFMTENNLIFQSQHGFRNKHSCKTAVSELIGNICKGHEKGKHTLAIFLDLSKAFDTIGHNILFRKLEIYSICGKALEWLKSNLTNCVLKVKCRIASSELDEISDSYPVEYGAPQGSCLGPLIFLIFMNDLHMNLEHCKCILFADDTTIYFTHNNLRYMEWCVQEDLNKIDDCFKANKLTINATKSNGILFHRKRLTTTNIALKIDNESLPLVKSTKFLGVWVDNSL